MRDISLAIFLTAAFLVSFAIGKVEYLKNEDTIIVEGT
jgi:hypothetical protein